MKPITLPQTQISNNFNGYLHELIDTVTTVNMVASILRDELYEKKEIKKESIVNTLYFASSRITHIVRNYLYTQSMEKIDYDYNKLKTKFDLTDKIKDCVARISVIYERTNDVELKIDNTPSFIIANEDHFTYLIDEVLHHAFKSSSKGKLILISLVHTSKKELLLTIDDFGQKNEYMRNGRKKTPKNIDYVSALENMPDLKLCQKILSFHQGEFNFCKKNTPGYLVTIKLPKQC